MASWSDRRFQTLIHPEAAIASRKSDEEKAREYLCRLDAPKTHHHEAEYTDAVQTRSYAAELLHNRRESIYECMAAFLPVIQNRKSLGIKGRPCMRDEFIPDLELR